MKICNTCGRAVRNSYEICPFCSGELSVMTPEKAFAVKSVSINPQFAENIPHCPVCGSIDIEKISFGSRAASVVGLGLLSKKINKTFHCKSCGYNF